MDIQKLKQLLSREEGEKLDFKAKLCLSTESEKKELVKDVTAIANSRGGRGHILYGVEDKTKRILGIDKSTFGEEQIQQIIYNRSDPPVPVQVDFIEVDKKTVAVITVFRSRHAPHQMIQTGAFYIRRGSTTDFARRSELASIMQENGLLSFETVIKTDAKLDDLDMDLVKDYFAGLQIIGDSPNNILLETFGFIGDKGNGDYCPTIGGLLLFGKNPGNYLPHCYVKIIHKNEIEMITGNILTILDKASVRIKKIVNDATYPYEAVEEALANALVHRDYLDSSRGITVVISRRSIEISNPGAMSEGNKIYGHIKEYDPVRRNPWLYQRLLATDKKTRFLKYGLGLSKIKKALKTIGNVKFINLGRHNTFKVVLPIKCNQEEISFKHKKNAKHR